MGEGNKRLYVGNLYPEVTQDELKDRFKRFGEVNGVEIKQKTDIDGQPVQTFGFVNITMSDANLTQCINTLANTKWKGYMLRIQQAKESFMSRLARERLDQDKNGAKPTENKHLSPDKFKGKPREEYQRKDRNDRNKRHQSDASYDPLSLVKSRVDVDSTGQTGKKIVARHLGGERTEADRSSAQSGNFTRLGSRRRADEGEDPLKSEDFMPKQKSTYDPLKMIRKHTGREGDGGGGGGDKPVDEGVVDNGVVIFGDDETAGPPGKKRKVYHSSDEEEDTPKAELKQVESKKKKKSEEEKMKEKAMLRERFQQRLEEKKRSEEEFKAKNKSPKVEKSSRFYAASSDDDEDENEEDSATKKPSGQNIMKKFQSFSSSVWADSDEEVEDATKADQNDVDDLDDNTEDQSEKEEDELMEEDDIQGERNRNYDILSQVVGKKVQKVVPKVERQEVRDYMPRFDPDAIDDRKAEEVEEPASEDTADQLEENPDNSRTYEVTKNLKQAFSSSGGGGGGGGGFSFGFGRSAAPATVKEEDTSRPGPRLFKLDPDDVKERIRPTDFSETFGSQLEGRRDFAEATFFFNSDDERIKEGLRFFFTEREDLEKVRTEYEKKRPELAAIFKKKVRSKAQLLRSNHKNNKPVERAKGRRRRQKKRENFRK